MNRDEYVRRLKRDLDRWNGQIAAWEATLHEIRNDAREKLAGRIESWHEQRNAVAQRLRELQSASNAAWRDVARGTDRAWRDLGEAFERAREEFEPGSDKRPPG